MQLEASDIEGLKPLIEAIVRATVAEVLQGCNAAPAVEQSFTEAEAAAFLKLKPWQLRDLRRANPPKIGCFKVGRNSPRYTRQHLLDYQQQNEAKEGSSNGQHSNRKRSA